MNIQKTLKKITNQQNLMLISIVLKKIDWADDNSDIKSEEYNNIIKNIDTKINDKLDEYILKLKEHFSH